MRPPTPRQTDISGALARSFGLTRLIVELGVLSSFAFSLMLFIAAIVQAYQTLVRTWSSLGEADTTKTLIVAAVEQADLLLIGVALLMISLGLQALVVGDVRNAPAWLGVRSFDDLKQRLIGIVVVALATHFLSVALDWNGSSNLLPYALALSAVILAVTAYSVVLGQHGRQASGVNEGETDHHQ